MEGNKTPELERWFSLEEISKHLGVSKDTIRGWIKKETIRSAHQVYLDW